MFKTYKVLKSFEYMHITQKVDTWLELHPREATFLLMGGFIEERKAAASETDDATNKPTTRTKK
ncbi:hypothetical protein LGM46_03445 [Burkholderia arboris]|uniref:Uncharacterized protein n=1 Tax=Burkholderia metallica TaxID=488729 RepID=A0ABT8PJZ1_9BURK|nr:MULTISPECIES: hypothetical protein [Burkholderia cepacia complex]MCA8032022.1 hypothetical protein [Burkholderia arboris]MDN7935192.1 hypothetical protein [Burkholderia metallica]